VCDVLILLLHLLLPPPLLPLLLPWRCLQAKPGVKLHMLGETVDGHDLDVLQVRSCSSLTAVTEAALYCEQPARCGFEWIAARSVLAVCAAAVCMLFMRLCM
jgi:hypothetical protein